VHSIFLMPFIEEIDFSPLYVHVPFSKISWIYECELISRPSILLHWSSFSFHVTSQLFWLMYPCSKFWSQALWCLQNFFSAQDHSLATLVFFVCLFLCLFFVVPYEFHSCFSYFCESDWYFHGNCTEAKMIILMILILLVHQQEISFYFLWSSIIQSVL
jgi:hypothetical protein